MTRGRTGPTEAQRDSGASVVAARMVLSIITAMMPPGTASPRRLVARVVIFAMLAVVYWAGGRAAEADLTRTRVGVDDANIYFRYARNIADGHGCVWNPGGERVEGCTSPLWTAICATAFLVTPAPERLLFTLGALLAAVASLLVVVGAAAACGDDEDGAATACIGAGMLAWVVCTPGHVIWMTATLMDTAAFLCVVATSWIVALAWIAAPQRRRRQAAFGAALALLVLARPEGMLAAAALLAAATVMRRRPHRSEGAASAIPVRSTVAVPALAFLATVACLFIARRLYFGFWLPNTYYAKVDADLLYRVKGGWSYIAGFAAAHPAAIVAVIVCAVIAWRRSRSDALVCSLALLAFCTAQILFVGGDHFGCWRVVQPIWPFFLVPMAAAARVLTRRVARLAMFVLLPVVIASITAVTTTCRWDRIEEDSQLYFPIADQGRATGRIFNEIFAASDRPRVGVIAAGAFPFVYEGVSFDLLGLNDVEVAHASRERRARKHGHGAFHPRTFFARAPDLILGLMDPLPVSAPRPPPERILLVDLAPADVARFDDLYAPVAISTPAAYALGMMLPAWARRDWLARNKDRLSGAMREVVPDGSGFAYR